MSNDSNGRNTQQIKGQARAEARLDTLENRVEVEAQRRTENAKGIAALEARVKILERRASVLPAAAGLWNSTNGKILIVGIVVVLLAVVGWNAADVARMLAGILGGQE